MKRFLSLLAALAATFLHGCDTAEFYNLKPGVSTVAEVFERMGLPAAEYPNADGTITYEYPRGPNGVHCHMVTVGADKILVRIDQVLTEANFAKVKEGMGREEIRRLLGRPGEVTTFPMKNEEVWDWRYEGTPQINEYHFHVHFDPATGKVLSTSRRTVSHG
ncbi:MAG: outer membrane protein assembly factor BamE [Rhodocyclaceae bacterium]|nr:outer membrane protein assembly factor BamE [Rhodocyclaceae bacterium]